MTELETLQQYIDEAGSIVFFGGAGVSTESGVPDFRVWTAFITRSGNIPRKPS